MRPRVLAIALITSVLPFGIDRLISAVSLSGVEPGGLLEEAGRLRAADLQREPDRDVCFLVIGRHSAVLSLVGELTWFR